VCKFFSRTQIARLESMIKELVNELCDKIIRRGILHLLLERWSLCTNSDRNKHWETIRCH
jgi:hypothetical protein